MLRELKHKVYGLAVRAHVRTYGPRPDAPERTVEMACARDCEVMGGSEACECLAPCTCIGCSAQCGLRFKSYTPPSA